ncbi:MAG: DNA-directed RNA polymerase subunit beta [Chloroflexota bacterium]|nr:MAG: DNA-directed RNA polymerase subunit beta [Chloroflexota bacterium]
MVSTAIPVELNKSLSTNRKSYARIADVLRIPSLIDVQRRSFRWFLDEGLRELFAEISPIQDFTGQRLELRFLDYAFGEPKYSDIECRERDMTFAVPLRVRVQLLIKETGEIKEQDIFMGDFPKMTANGTFVINGAERVVVSQLVRSPGSYFTLVEDPTTGRELCYAKLIPNRGAWLEFETSNKDVISVKVDRKRKIPVTTLLRAVGVGTDEELMALFEEVESGSERSYIRATIDRDPTKKVDEGLIEFYKRLRPGDPPTLDNARSLVSSLFFNFRRYDLGKVGRHKLNKRLGMTVPMTQRVLTKEDLVEIVRQIIRINRGEDHPDDIDHLGNRRVRAVGELIQNQFRIGLLRMERVVKERMSISDLETVTPSALINIRPVVAAIKEFFGGSQLSQFMDQTNPLAELTHKRRLSALGPGGLSRERAGFEVRDVHHSHYGRICPIETPEGPNIGLIGSLATYGMINEYGFIETPYRKVIKEVENQPGALEGHMLNEKLTGSAGETIADRGTRIDAELAKRIAAEIQAPSVRVRPFVSSEISYLTADEEERYVVAQANAGLSEMNEFKEDRIEARYRERFVLEAPEKLDYMDVSPKQLVSVAASLIPFLEHDDANRALMGSNMQRQAVPLLRPEAPIVGTGMERQAAEDSGQLVLSTVEGVVVGCSSVQIDVRTDDGELVSYPLIKFTRSNQGTCINQRPIVTKGDRVAPGSVLADSSSTEKGELALGQNVLCAFMSWEGCNFEDAIIISENVVAEDKFTSIHIEKHEVEARDTKLGPEEITRDIPNVGEESLRDLDERGIIRVGAEVGPGDILVGKITPKGETELTAEEKLLRAIFGEKAREVKDTSLRVPHGERGKVVDVRVFSRANHDELPAGINELVRVSIAQKRKIAEGDKMAGRHGNKGVIARILPVEDMPYLADGTPIDIILNPIGVPSRMNVGQILETHLGLAAQALGFKVQTPVFDGASITSIEDALARAWLIARAMEPASPDGTHHSDTQRVKQTKGWLAEKGMDADRVFGEYHYGAAKDACLRIWLEDLGVDPQGLEGEELEALAEKTGMEMREPVPVYGKAQLYDGRTGDPFDTPVTVGFIYMLKLVHLVEDKIHARSTGPYSLITQQPLGGKAQFGGQRFGEMEVWALEAYGAAHTLQEILTVKSDDVVGRVKTYEAIVKGENILEPGVPESFKVLVKELQSLGLAIEVLNEDEERITFVEDTGADVLPELTGEFGMDFEGELEPHDHDEEE